MSKPSIRGTAFLDTISQTLNRGQAIVIWHQLPWAGGAQEWFLVTEEAALLEVLARGQVGAAFTAYEWRAAPWPPVTTEEWLSQVAASIEDGGHDLLVATSAALRAGVTPLTWVSDLDELRDWYAQHQGAPVAAMRLPRASLELVRGYVPDQDGMAKSPLAQDRWSWLL